MENNNVIKKLTHINIYDPIDLPTIPAKTLKTKSKDDVVKLVKDLKA